LESKFKAYKERRAHRIKIASIFATPWILYCLLIVWINFLNEGLATILTVIGLFAFIFSAVFVDLRFWISESSETMIFVNLYRAIDFLELCSEEKETSRLYLGKAAKHVKNVITELDELTSPEKVKINSVLFDKEYAEPLESLSENLESRILPRIIESKNMLKMCSMLRGMAKIFGEIQKPIDMNDINSLNENLKSLKEISLKVKPTIFKTAIKSKPMILVVSAFLGFFSITIIAFFYCQLLTMDFFDFMRNNLQYILTGGAAFTALFSGVLIIKK